MPIERIEVGGVTRVHFPSTRSGTILPVSYSVILDEPKMFMARKKETPGME